MNCQLKPKSFNQVKSMPLKHRRWDLIWLLLIFLVLGIWFLGLNVQLWMGWGAAPSWWQRYRDSERQLLAKQEQVAAKLATNTAFLEELQAYASHPDYYEETVRMELNWISPGEKYYYVAGE